MTDTDDQLYRAVQQVRNFFVEIARMLTDCDRLMSEAGWGSAATASLSGNSTSINYPKWWVPHVMHRNYTNADQPDILKTIVVVLEDEWEERLSEITIVATKYKSADGGAVGINSTDNSVWWLTQADREADGKVRVITAEDPIGADFERFNQIQLFAQPISLVTNVDLIKSKLVDVLVSL